jgi:hypothetical protein
MIRNAVLYGLAGISISALGQGAFGQVSEYVYVETNLSPANSIRAFERGAPGQLSEISGSPFPTGGAGSGYNGVAVGPDDSDQEIVTNAGRSLLFAINAGSDSIAVMPIASDGSLAAMKAPRFLQEATIRFHSISPAICSSWLTRPAIPTAQPRYCLATIPLLSIMMAVFRQPTPRATTLRMRLIQRFLLGQVLRLSRYTRSQAQTWCLAMICSPT